VADIEALLDSLTLEEKATLTAGGGMMSTAGIERVGIPQVNVTDGPNGARGPSYPGIGGAASTCIPCGSALGATWDAALVEALGALVGREAFDRGCRGLLAPTVNLHRSVLAGRNFECYSEDPLLTGRLAAAYVRGVQSNGVFATVKHFVGNEAEFERNSISSVIDERALRELYMLPFELAVREGGALGIMTGYNRLNGRWLTEQPRFLIDILRHEWGFEGLVMTDWFAMTDRTASLGAGLDLEMPGPGRALGANLRSAVADGKVPRGDLNEAVRRLLGGLDRIGALDDPTPPNRPAEPGPADAALLRRAAAEAAVLLVNDGILPLDPGTLARLAVLGDHAVTPRIQGGGSAQVVQRPVTSPLSALTGALGDGTEIVAERAVEVDRSATLLGHSAMPAPAGFALDVYASSDLAGEAVQQSRLDELRLFVLDAAAQGFPGDQWSVRARGTVVPAESGAFELALAQSGRARVLVNGEIVLDGVAHPPPPGGTDFFGFASQEMSTRVEVVAGSPLEVVVEFTRTGAMLAGFRVGFRTVDADALMERAVGAARGADVAVVFVGTTREWETEGRDRESFGLPSRQDELVRRVAAVNPRTVVVVNAGAPVDLPWADDVAAVLWSWFGGEQMGPAVADVLTGAEPGGRLPTTIPVRLEHSPAHDNFPGENGELRYGEGLFMGYRGYEHRCITPRFPFGHGLGYTEFEYGAPGLSEVTFAPGETLTVSIPVTNVGGRAGTEVVQCYVAPGATALARPPKELKAFAKIRLEPGESGIVELRLDERSFAHWDPGQPDLEELAARFPGLGVRDRSRGGRPPGWRIDPGHYTVLIGRSSADIVARTGVEVSLP